MCTGCLKTNSLTATVAMRPRAMRPASVPPATSTCAMIQPPKMSPFWFASAGIGMTRSAGCLSAGSFSMRDVVQWPAAERREAGAEDEARIDEIRLRDDALVEHAPGFGEVGPDQLLDELRTVGIGRRLLRLTIGPAVDALAGLLAEPAGVDVRAEHLRNGRGVLRQRFAGMQADVEADRVGEFGRAHRHAELFHRGIERLGLGALIDQPECVLHVRAEYAIDEESRRVLHRQRQLVDLAHERRGILGDLRARLRA